MAVEARPVVRGRRARLRPGGHLAVVIGDVRNQGRYYSAQAAILGWYPPEVVEAVLIKAQHHVRSDSRAYAGALIRIMHEYVIVLRAGGSRPLPPQATRAIPH